MTFNELSKRQRDELKQVYLMDVEGVCLSYGELSSVGEFVTDEQIEAEFGGVTFSSDDFWCSCGR